MTTVRTLKRAKNVAASEFFGSTTCPEIGWIAIYLFRAGACSLAGTAAQRAPAQQPDALPNAFLAVAAVPGRPRRP
jgi:hypothetical protein